MKKKLANDFEQVQSPFSPRAIIEEAYERYADELYQYALMILADHGAAEDAVQQVFVKTIKMEKRLLQVESYNGYLRTAVRNECYGTIKKRKRFDGLIKMLSSKPILEKLDERITAEDEQKLIEKTIRKLPAEQREVLHMKIYENRTFLEIGKMIGVSTNTVASRYRYAMDKLREMPALSNRAKGNYHE